MPTQRETIVDLEKKFWQSIVDEDTDTALAMLTEPALMVSEHGTMEFDHAAYRHMAEKGPMVLRSYELSDMHVLFPNDNTAVITYHSKQEMAPRGKREGSVQEMNFSSTWIKDRDSWKCVVHTETPARGRAARQ